MKKRIIRGLSAILFTLSCSTLIAFASLADTPGTVNGSVDSVTDSQIGGWAWNSEDMDEIINVELHIYPSGSSEEIHTGSVKAEQYRHDLHTAYKDGYHGFQYDIDWLSLEGTSFDIKAYAVSKTERVLLSGISSYTKRQAASRLLRKKQHFRNNRNNMVPGFVMETSANEAAETQAAASEAQVTPVTTSLGIFTTSGYCSCEKCSSGYGLTYSGTVPQANHTISADITKLPIGTRVMIGDIIYTVEDIGSKVTGNKIDIYYASHEEALNHGLQEVEVFLVEE